MNLLISHRGVAQRTERMSSLQWSQVVSAVLVDLRASSSSSTLSYPYTPQTTVMHAGIFNFMVMIAVDLVLEFGDALRLQGTAIAAGVLVSFAILEPQCLPGITPVSLMIGSIECLKRINRNAQHVYGVDMENIRITLALVRPCSRSSSRHQRDSLLELTRWPHSNAGHLGVESSAPGPLGFGGDHLESPATTTTRST